MASLSFACLSDKWDGSQAVGWLEGITDFNSRVAPSASLSSQLPSCPIQQRELSKSIEAEMIRQLLHDSTEWDLARLRANAALSASAWLGATPSVDLRQSFTHREFSCLIRFW